MQKYLYIFMILSQVISGQTANRSLLNYHNRNCTGGVGFCSDSESISEKNSDVKFSNKISNKMTMTIPKNKLSAQELQELSTDNYFQVSGLKSFILPNGITTKSTNKFTNSKIAIGNYPIKIEEDSIKIFFDIVESK